MLKITVFALVEDVLGLYCDFEEEFLELDVVEAIFSVAWPANGRAKEQSKRIFRKKERSNVGPQCEEVDGVEADLVLSCG